MLISRASSPSHFRGASFDSIKPTRYTSAILFCRHPPVSRFVLRLFNSAVVPFLSLSLSPPLTLCTVRVQVTIVSVPYSRAICNFSIIANFFSLTKWFVDRIWIVRGYGVLEPSCIVRRARAHCRVRHGPTPVGISPEKPEIFAITLNVRSPYIASGGGGIKGKMTRHVLLRYNTIVFFPPSRRYDAVAGTENGGQGGGVRGSCGDGKNGGEKSVAKKTHSI